MHGDANHVLEEEVVWWVGEVGRRPVEMCGGWAPVLVSLTVAGKRDGVTRCFPRLAIVNGSCLEDQRTHIEVFKGQPEAAEHMASEGRRRDREGKKGLVPGMASDRLGPRRKAESTRLPIENSSFTLYYTQHERIACVVFSSF